MSTKQWLGFEHIPKAPKIEKELGAFFAVFEKAFDADRDDIYIDDKYDFQKATTQLLVKITDSKVLNKIPIHPKLKAYGWSRSGDAFKTDGLTVNVRIQKSGGIRGTGKLPRKGESLSNPSTAEQELGTICYFEEMINKRTPTQQYISDKVGYGFDSTWMYSFEQQWKAFSANHKINPRAKIYLDSAKNDSDIIVDLAKKFGLKDLKDNWNPADIWVMDIKPSVIETETKSIKTLDEYNSYLESKFHSGQIIGVSLKKVSTNKKGKYEVVQAKDLPVVNLQMDTTIFNPTGKNFVLMTKGTPSGFQLRVGYKASSITRVGDIRVYLEGRQKGSSVQLGGVSSKMFPEFIKQYGFDLASDKNRIFSNPKQYLSNTLPVIQKHKNITNKGSISSETELQLLSSAWLTYYMEILIQGGPELLKDCYYSAIKKNKYSSIHCKVS